MGKALLNAGNGVGDSEAVPHHPPDSGLKPLKACFAKKLHKSNTGINVLKPYSEPEIVVSNSNGNVYVQYNYVVPKELRSFYDRGTKRFIVKKGINSQKSLEEKIEAAEIIRQTTSVALKHGIINPFERQLKKYRRLAIHFDEAIEVQEKAERLTPEQLRLQTTIKDCFALFLKSRATRTKNTNSLSTAKGTVKWLTEYFESKGLMDEPAESVTRLQISEALEKAAKSKVWENVTYNKELTNAMTLFNWLEKEEYISKNRAQGKLDKKSESKSMHKWFDRDTLKLVKDKLIEDKNYPVLRAMQFTYFILIRSKAELLKLKAGDIDRTLKRVRFSADLSKTSVEAYRDYPPEFDKVLDEMDFDNIPKDWFVFGKGGLPNKQKCHKDFLAEQFKLVREELGLSSKHTIYASKHTRIVHELMKGTDGEDISHMARHTDLKTKKEYLRDYDITLKNIYKPEDLTF